MNICMARVKWFDEIIGHGFLVADNRMEVYFHYTDVIVKKDPYIRPGQEVKCVLRSELAKVATKVLLS